MPSCCLPAGGSVPERFGTAAYQLFVGVFTRTCDLIYGTTSEPLQEEQESECWVPSCVSGSYKKFTQLLASSSTASSENPILELVLRTCDIVFTIYLAIISLILYTSMTLIDVANSITCNLGKAESAGINKSSDIGKTQSTEE